MSGLSLDAFVTTVGATDPGGPHDRSPRPSLAPLFGGCAPSGPLGRAARRPNIVFIMTDDHARSAMSLYGNRIPQTPNLDRIAAEGMRFDQAFVTNSLCLPSRATFLTGQYSHTHGMRASGEESGFTREPRLRNAQTWPLLLRARLPHRHGRQVAHQHPARGLRLHRDDQGPGRLLRPADVDPGRMAHRQGPYRRRDRRTRAALPAQRAARQALRTALPVQGPAPRVEPGAALPPALRGRGDPAATGLRRTAGSAFAGRAGHDDAHRRDAGLPQGRSARRRRRRSAGARISCTNITNTLACTAYARTAACATRAGS